MKLHEIFDRDPRTTPLPNNGQARIDGDLDAPALAELRAELETFVCEGEFAGILQRILEDFLENLGHTKQKSAWVAGFFGSGKSHLLKMLTHLWTNTDLGGGERARGLVHGGLPDPVLAALKELDVQARRTGVPAVSAAGTLLEGNDRVRETILAVLLEARGWPKQYPQAMFCFWLRESGWLEPVRQAVEDAGKDWGRELNNLYVSPVIRKALLAANPDLAASEKEVGQVLRSQFPRTESDITTDQFTDAARKALEIEGVLPLTLLVLDEVQQYINVDTDRAKYVTEVAEVLQTRFDSRVMLVGAGQSALSSGTDALMWLRDRFEISRQLQDADVEAVIRKVVLRKKPTAEPAVQGVLERHAGEVARHLRGTRAGERSEDRQTRVADYPQLSTRKRFWENCFQAIDAAGTHSQLRSQLRILHDALQERADEDLGAVLPASTLYDALAPSLVNTGVLLNELHTRIQRLQDGSPEGRLRHDLCGLVFLIGKLPREGAADTGIRASAEHLADLLVEDLGRDSGPFRKSVAEHLQDLARDGTLLEIDGEYRLQTAISAEWERSYRERLTSLRQDSTTASTRREHLLASRVQEILDGIKPLQGAAKERRAVVLHTGLEGPDTQGPQVVVWLRSGWSARPSEVEGDARKRGQEDPVLHVYVPKTSVEEVKDRVLEVEAARQVLEHHGAASSNEAREARQAMESRLRASTEARDALVTSLLAAAKVFRGGGTEVFGDTLAARIEEGTRSSLARLFPRFDHGDHGSWATAWKHARSGADAPLAAVGWDQPTEDHAVAKEILARVGTGSRGSDLQKTLRAPPFGWPQDAVDATLLALCRSGHLRARREGRALSADQLDQTTLKSAEFLPEKIRLGSSEKIALRGIFKEAGIPTKSGEEERRAPEYLRRLVDLAREAGGEAPLPAPPDTTLLDDLESRAGSDQLAAILAAREDLEALRTQCASLVARARKRLGTWSLARDLARHAEDLPVHAQVAPELEAIRAQRSLLADPDPLTPLAGKLASALREALTRIHTDLTRATGEATDELERDPTWSQLEAADRKAILEEVGLTAPGILAIASDRELLRTLDRYPLRARRGDVELARTSRVANALARAARRIHPDTETTTITLRRGTLATPEDVQAWIDEHATKLRDAVARGPVVVR